MKIVSIIKSQSSECWIAYKTDKPITPEIRKVFEELYAGRPDNGGVQYGFHGGDIQLQADCPANFTEFVSTILTQAEGHVSRLNDIRQQKAAVEESQVAEAVKRNAERQKLPVV